MINRILPKTDHSTEKVVVNWILFFFLATLSLQCWRIFSLNATYDQGLFLQEIWNGLQGHAFESTLAAELSAPVKFNSAIPAIGYRHLAQHFTPLLYFWTPLVGILGVWALPLIQVSLVSLAGWVLYLLGKEHLPKKLAGWITCSFFATGTVIGPTLENFHDLCLVPLIVFSLLLGISKENKFLYFFPALLLPLIREDVGLLAFGIGFWMILRRTNWRIWGIGLCIYSVISVLVITNFVMPLFGTELTERFMQERFSQYLNGQHGGPIDVLIAMLKNPILLISEIISPGRKTISFLITLGLPLAFVPFLSPDTWLLIGVPLFVALSSQGGNALAVHLRFVLYLVPGIFAGSIFWWRDHTYIYKKLSFKRLWKVCLSTALIFAIIGNPHRSFSAFIPDSVNPWVHVPIQKQFSRGINTREILSLIPKEASIASETHLIPQLATRRVLMRFPENYKYIDTHKNIKEVDLIVSQPRFNADYLPAFHHHGLWLKNSIFKIQELVFKKNNYGVLYCSPKGIILKKGLVSSAKNINCLQEEINFGINRLQRNKHKKYL